LFDRQRGKPSRRWVPMATLEKVFALREEVFRSERGAFSREAGSRTRDRAELQNWVKQVLQGSESGGAGVQAWSGSETARASAPTGDAVAHRREPAPVVSGRALVRPDRDSGRRDHRDLIRPTVEEESTATVMAGLREVMERHGAFCAPYSDRGSHFWLTPKVGGQVYRHRLTPGGRELHELGVQMIPTYSPQARGRSERNFGTWQGRLPQEPRLHKIARSGSCQCLSARALHRRL
jgi:hypothetical protein